MRMDRTAEKKEVKETDILYEKNRKDTYRKHVLSSAVWVFQTSLHVHIV